MTFLKAMPPERTDQPALYAEVWAEKSRPSVRRSTALPIPRRSRQRGRQGKFQAYLDVQTCFSRYSATNVLLILAQKPDATQLKDFDG